jgi:pimeloyl-ACP methyl ester carboxylesterase
MVCSYDGDRRLTSSTAWSEIVKTIRTELLEIAYEEGGHQSGPLVLLLHGWPDTPRGWKRITEQLHAKGWRTIAPYLRGTGPTKFLHDETPRIGAGVALARDAMDLVDKLGIDRFAVVGHDWGARVAYTLSALFPERVTTISALALAYQPKASSRFLRLSKPSGSGTSGSCVWMPA